MRSNIESEIKKIIERTFKNYDKRQILEEVFSALAKHQENFLSDLENRINDESNKQDWNKDFEIAVKFVKSVKSGDTECERGFFPQDVYSAYIFDDDEESEIPMSDTFFVNVSYDELKNICASKYHGRLITSDGTVKNFSYTIQRNERFIAAEKILFEVAALYKIKRPVIFSPYARRAVDIKIFDVAATELKKSRVDLMPEKNDLSEKILKGKLFWNVQIDSGEMRRGGEVDEYIGADGNLIRYKYFHFFNEDEKVFILPAQHCDDLHVIKTESGDKKITLGYNSVLKERGYQKVMLTDVPINSDDVFTNDFPRKNDKLRLRTEGDVSKVLACFNATRFGQICPAQFESFNADSFKPLEVYAKTDSYFYPAENSLLGDVSNKPVCCIKFGGDSIFKIDYANYVLHYFNQNYPEFSWVGVE